MDLSHHQPRPARRRRHPGGFTLVEIAVVLAIIGVISAVSWGSVRRLLPRYRLVRATNGLAKDIAGLRMVAIDTNCETRILVEQLDDDLADLSSWAGAWRLQSGNASINSTRWEDLPVDAAEDRVDDDHGENPVDIGPSGNREAARIGLTMPVHLAGPGTGNGDAVVFTPRGWVANPAADFDSAGYITLDLTNKEALARGLEDTLSVRIARSGYVRIESSMGTSSSAPVGTERSSSHGS
jgi:prepilin-type N-terminal cleavage/methylation domain-containing protein